MIKCLTWAYINFRSRGLLRFCRKLKFASHYKPVNKRCIICQTARTMCGELKVRLSWIQKRSIVRETNGSANSERALILPFWASLQRAVCVPESHWVWLWRREPPVRACLASSSFSSCRTSIKSWQNTHAIIFTDSMSLTATKGENWNGKPRLKCVSGRHPPS